MAQWDRTDLLARLRNITRRPAADQDLTDGIAYQALTDAQLALAYELAGHIPGVMYGAPVKLVTSDSGVTYTPPGTPTPEILGHIELYERVNDTQPMRPGPYWDAGADYTWDGPSTVRMPGNRARTFGDGPYARYITKPTLIDASTEPTLVPKDAWRAGLYLAAAKWAEMGGLRDPSPYLRQYQAALWGDPNQPGSVGIISAYKLQYHGQASGGGGMGLWYRSGDFGR